MKFTKVATPATKAISALSPKMKDFYVRLVDQAESVYDGKRGEWRWWTVYLDNARGSETVTEFRSALSVLSKAGLYRVLDGYAFGEVLTKKFGSSEK